MNKQQTKMFIILVSFLAVIQFISIMRMQEIEDRLSLRIEQIDKRIYELDQNPINRIFQR